MNNSPQTEGRDGDRAGGRPYPEIGMANRAWRVSLMTGFVSHYDHPRCPRAVSGDQEVAGTKGCRKQPDAIAPACLVYGLPLTMTCALESGGNGASPSVPSSYAIESPKPVGGV